MSEAGPTRLAGFGIERGHRGRVVKGTRSCGIGTSGTGRAPAPRSGQCASAPVVSGHSSADQFSRGVVDDWALPVSPAEFLDAFASWPVGPFDRAERLVRQTAPEVPIGCLSNTNEVHWDGNAEHWPIVAEFGHRFVSHHMGRVKPDAEVFMWVAEAVGRGPTRWDQPAGGAGAVGP